MISNEYSDFFKNNLEGKYTEGCVAYVTGRPKSGRTDSAIKLAIEAVNDNNRGLVFFSTELTHSEAVARLVECGCACESVAITHLQVDAFSEDKIKDTLKVIELAVSENGVAIFDHLNYPHLDNAMTSYIMTSLSKIAREHKALILPACHSSEFINSMASQLGDVAIGVSVKRHISYTTCLQINEQCE
jgi:replicative DNA helicase